MTRVQNLWQRTLDELCFLESLDEKQQNTFFTLRRKCKKASAVLLQHAAAQRTLTVTKVQDDKSRCYVAPRFDRHTALKPWFCFQVLSAPVGFIWKPTLSCRMRHVRDAFYIDAALGMLAAFKAWRSVCSKLFSQMDTG